jgi:hypothetical protein
MPSFSGTSSTTTGPEQRKGPDSPVVPAVVWTAAPADTVRPPFKSELLATLGPGWEWTCPRCGEPSTFYVPESDYLVQVCIKAGACVDCLYPSEEGK